MNEVQDETHAELIMQIQGMTRLLLKIAHAFVGNSTYKIAGEIQSPVLARFLKSQLNGGVLALCSIRLLDEKTETYTMNHSSIKTLIFPYTKPKGFNSKDLYTCSLLLSGFYKKRN